MTPTLMILLGLTSTSTVVLTIRDIITTNQVKRLTEENHRLRHAAMDASMRRHPAFQGRKEDRL